MPEKDNFAARVLVKTIPSGAMETDGSSAASINPLSGSGWKQVTGAGGTVFAVWSGYIDLTGMTMTQDYSFGVQNTDVQECNQWVGDADAFTVFDLVTDVPVDWSEALLQTDGLHIVLPGMQSSQRNLENIISGKGRAFYRNQTIPGGTAMHQAWSWGTNLASASDRLYIYRVMTFTSLGPSVSFSAPPTAIVMPTIFFEETDLAHIERLRRSYITQGPFS